jgi:hypothetical protein
VPNSTAKSQLQSQHEYKGQTLKYKENAAATSTTAAADTTTTIVFSLPPKHTSERENARWKASRYVVFPAPHCEGAIKGGRNIDELTNHRYLQSSQGFIKSYFDWLFKRVTLAGGGIKCVQGVVPQSLI